MNYPPDEQDFLLRMGMLARCNSGGQVFSIGHVETLDRYADCTGFRCPTCGQRHDDRQSWTGGPDDRMGYRVVREVTYNQWGDLRTFTP